MNYLSRINSQGFTIIEHIYSNEEVSNMISIMEQITYQNTDKSTYRKSNDLFAIRQVLKEIPQMFGPVFNDRLKEIIRSNFGDDYFITKSIYFDKPENSNWFVSYHQDLTISVNKKAEAEGFENWTVKQNQFAVQPPEKVLQKSFTIRIHLDKTTNDNGALRVINNSHANGIVRTENFQRQDQTESICEVGKGGIMIMKPLLFHASSKTTNNERRRVIHIEFCNQELPGDLDWSEKIKVDLN